MGSVSLVRASSTTLALTAAAREGQAEEQRGPRTPASDVFVSTPDDMDHFLTSYESSHQRWRWFCARCGTNIAYRAIMPDGFPNMLDITMGSIDRRYLESNALVPERRLWWDYGIDWIRRLAIKGYGALPIHPDYRIADSVKLQENTL